ncbi:D-alanyl-D-alanine carboxypeptidase (penicillin-binding protein 5/6) [Streptomyces collinus]|uniref:D-alanyl-D-alanine carboxypeptidase (Penicillin-binding protein 5/6) n=1 Tax=Streptomyces collinus TaxID=42684 RepID=A0AA89TQ74_STRCU|nr:D-alanyl-D-alanine carboxypeptidase (penicillin-binding protein 5/6) [Streptomyces collinus]
MTIGFPSRVTVSAGVLCLAGLMALTPTAATADPGGAEPTPPGGPRAAAPHPSLLYRPGTQVRLGAGASRVPKVSALSWVVADARTGEVLAAHNAHRKLPPASTLKTLFALTVLPGLPSGIRHTVRARELKGIGAGSSLVGVAEGHTYRIADLWRGVFLNSGNDAVHVLAELNGGWRLTAERMQAKARALGAHDTRVVSPDGYDAPGQVSSAYDLAVFGRAGLRNPDFARYCATVEAKFPGGGSGSYPILNTNRLLSGAKGVKPYRGLIGIKNGYTSEAGSTLVAAARRDGRTLVVTVMNPQEGDGSAVYEEARSLLDWGFGSAGKVEAVGSLGAPPAPARPAVTTPPAVAAAVQGSVWTEAGLIAGAVGTGAAVVVLVLRLPVRRPGRS